MDNKKDMIELITDENMKMMASVLGDLESEVKFEIGHTEALSLIMLVLATVPSDGLATLRAMKHPAAAAITTLITQAIAAAIDIKTSEANHLATTPDVQAQAKAEVEAQLRNLGVKIPE